MANRLVKAPPNARVEVPFGIVDLHKDGNHTLYFCRYNGNGAQKEIELRGGLHVVELGIDGMQDNEPS